MASVNPIEPGELLLHVGLHKTGTTALQVALADARTELAAHGVLYPGSGTFQHRPILAGADRMYGWQNNGAREVPKKYWNDLVQEARSDGRTIISSEFLDDVDPETARRMIDELGGPQRVRVVVTLRSIGAILPSAWQQRLKAGYTSTYNQFLKMVFAEQQTPKAQRFWYRHDQVAQVRRWADLVGADRTYAVIIPGGDRRAIFTAFEGLLGLPDGLLAGRTIAIQNRSMTAQEAEFVRRLNKEVAGDLTWDEYTRTVRRGLVLTMVEQRTPEPDEARIQTPEWAADTAAQYGRRFADGVAASGVTVIGDPAELASRPRSGRNQRPQSLAMAAAVAGAAGLVRRSTAPAEPTRAQALRILLRRRGKPAVEPAEPEGQ
jgi:hypothetical protein